MSTEKIDDVRDGAMDEIRVMDRAHAAGSETALLGPALDNVRQATTVDAVIEALNWWRLAYDALVVAPDRDVVIEEILELGVDSDAALARARRRAAAAYLAEVRQELGLTLDQLAELLGVDRSTIHRWETGALMPQSPGMVRLAMERLAQSGR